MTFILALIKYSYIFTKNGPFTKMIQQKNAKFFMLIEKSFITKKIVSNKKYICLNHMDIFGYL